MAPSYNLNLPTVYSSFDHHPNLSSAMPNRCISHWGDHYTHTLITPRQTIFADQLPTLPSSSSLQRLDSVNWASNTGSYCSLRRRSASQSLRKDFNDSFWLSQHQKHVAICDLITSHASHAPSTLPPITEHVEQVSHANYTPTLKVDPSQYFRYHLTSYGRPSRFYPRLLDTHRSEAPLDTLQSAGPNRNAKRDAMRLLGDIIEREVAEDGV